MTTIARRDTPSPEEIRRARLSAGLNQAEAAALVHRPAASRWSEWETGLKRMQADAFELFLIKTGQHKSYGRK